MLGGVIIPTIHLNEYKVYLYGVYQNVEIFLKYFRYNKIIISGIIDNDISKCGIVIDGVKYIHSAKLKEQIEEPKKTFVIVLKRFLNEFERQDIAFLLYDAGIRKYYYANDNDYYQVMANCFTGVIKYYRKNENILSHFYDSLVDSESKATLLEFIRVQMEAGFYRKNKLKEKINISTGREENNYISI